MKLWDSADGELGGSDGDAANLDLFFRDSSNPGTFGGDALEEGNGGGRSVVKRREW